MSRRNRRSRRRARATSNPGIKYARAVNRGKYSQITGERM